ncbi:MAG TPA: SpoIIE family protein phosphatase [Pirellulales bacterium]
MEETIRVLLIDDSLSDGLIVRQLLTADSSVSAALTAVHSLFDGIHRLKAGGIDAVLLDLSLPDSSGLATLARFQASCPEIPVLILTGSENEELAIESVHGGAQDYLVKWRFQPQSLVRALRYAIERQKRRHLEACIRSTNVELRAAREIQQRLCPASVPVLRGYELAGAWHPAQATCGDYYDFIRMGTRFLAIAIGDVCGHGLGPALLMAETRACLRTLATTDMDVAEILTKINQLLTEDLAGERFVTLLLARLDLQSRDLVYAGAGHQGHLLEASGHFALLDSTSQPLGLDRDLVVACGVERRLQEGELLLMVTDGVHEALSPDGEMFGMERVLRLIGDHCSEPAQTIVDHLHAAVQVFSAGAPQADDFTAVVLKVVDVAAAP